MTSLLSLSRRDNLSTLILIDEVLMRSRLRALSNSKCASSTAGTLEGQIVAVAFRCASIDGDQPLVRDILARCDSEVSRASLRFNELPVRDTQSRALLRLRSSRRSAISPLTATTAIARRVASPIEGRHSSCVCYRSVSESSRPSVRDEPAAPYPQRKPRC